MASLSYTHNKLLKSGFLPQHQDDLCESWISAKFCGTISFIKRGDRVDSFKVHSKREDRPEFDEFNSYHTGNLSSAIRMCEAMS